MDVNVQDNKEIDDRIYILIEHNILENSCTEIEELTTVF